MSAARSPRNWLIASHVVVALLGVAGGALYAHEVLPSTRILLGSLARKSVNDAAYLAVRFGSREHARATLESVARLPATNELEWGDRMTAELRLAAVEGELAAHATPSRHLAAARAACRRFRSSDCPPEELRTLAIKLVHGQR